MLNSSQIEKQKSAIDALNAGAWRVRVSDSDKAYLTSTKAVALARKIGYRQGLADALRVQAFGHIRKSDFDKATACLDEAKEAYEASNDLRGLAVVAEYFGIIQRYQGNVALALQSILKAIELSRQTGFADNEVTNLYQAGVTYRSLANYEKALDYLYQSLSLARSVGFSLMEAYNLHVIGSIFFETGDFEKALDYYQQGLTIRREAGDKWGEAGSLDNIGFTHLKLQDYGQAIDCCTASLAITESTGDKKGQANALFHLAEACKQKGDIPNAVKYAAKSLQIRKDSGDRRGEVEILLFTAGLANKNRPETIETLVAAQTIAVQIKAPDLESRTHFQLYEACRHDERFEEALKHLEHYMVLEKQLHKDAVNQKIANFEIVRKAEEIRKEAESVRLRNEELQRLNSEIEDQKQKLQRAITKLKATQAQLIQREKMASLGELIAGIAHEIQNPLNFVNNFSEVNKEMVDELQTEIRAGNQEAALAISIDIKDNEEKIAHHGQRADAIVKGMLQHSLAGKGEKQLADINQITDEYLRLSYQAMRSKDKAFQAGMETHFDERLPKITIVPQEIGRVLLNLFNNAFYAVRKKKEQADGTFEPVVTVVTKQQDDKIEIVVRDNGTGISQKHLNKIFHPFFTTKPTGEGTGLGLSLSYDIITKGHGGDLNVTTQEGEGTAFVVQLPIQAQQSNRKP